MRLRCVCMYIHKRVNPKRHTQTHTHTHTHTHIYIYIHTYIYLYICIYRTCVAVPARRATRASSCGPHADSVSAHAIYIYVCIDIYTYIHIYTYTYVCIVPASPCLRGAPLELPAAARTPTASLPRRSGASPLQTKVGVARSWRWAQVRHSCGASMDRLSGAGASAGFFLIPWG